MQSKVPLALIVLVVSLLFPISIHAQEESTDVKEVSTESAEESVSANPAQQTIQVVEQPVFVRTNIMPVLPPTVIAERPSMPSKPQRPHVPIITAPPLMLQQDLQEKGTSIEQVVKGEEDTSPTASVQDEQATSTEAVPQDMSSDASSSEPAPAPTSPVLDSPAALPKATEFETDELSPTQTP